MAAETGAAMGPRPADSALPWDHDQLTEHPCKFSAHCPRELPMTSHPAVASPAHMTTD
jgi:hypothetical protein